MTSLNSGEFDPEAIQKISRESERKYLFRILREIKVVSVGMFGISIKMLLTTSCEFTAAMNYIYMMLWQAKHC